MAVPAPNLVRRPELLVIRGVAARTRNGDEANVATARISALWRRFFGDGLAARAGAPIYAVYTEYETDVNGPYTLVIGSAQLANASPDLPNATIPAGNYLEFVASGPMPAIVVTGWEAVWSYFERPDAPRRLYLSDYECYDPTTPDQVRIGIGIQAEP